MRTNRRKYPQDALRWLMGVFLSAVIASAVTSAVFIAARPSPPQVDPRDQHAAAAKEVAQLLLPELEQYALAQLESQQPRPVSRVDVVYRTEPPIADVEVPMVAPDDNTLTKGGPIPWHLEVVSTSGERKMGRIVDIRDSGSLTNPGYIGVVEFHLETSERTLAVSGELPFAAPDGFEVITPAEYNELEESQNFSVQLASTEAEQWEYTFENWVPTTPPPGELPEPVKRQFNASIAQCTAAQPSMRINTERLVYFYSLRERRWMPRP